MAETKHPVGYASIDEAIKDGFKKVGGVSEALHVLKTGWYAIQERKLQNEKNRALKEAMRDDPRFKAMREQIKKQLGGGK